MNDYIQEALDFCKKTNTDMNFQYNGKVIDPWKIGMNTKHDQYQVTIERNGYSYTTVFNQSAYSTENGILPTEYDVLACMTKFEPGEYWDWCDEYGFENSRDSYHTWKECCKEWDAMCHLFGDVMEEFQMIC